jgi:hypothetical protein
VPLDRFRACFKASDYYMNYYMRGPRDHVIGLVEAQVALPNAHKKPAIGLVVSSS